MNKQKNSLQMYNMALLPGNYSEVIQTTGVYMSKILGANPNFGGQNVVKTNKCMGVSQFFGERTPGLPPKSTPMIQTSELENRRVFRRLGPMKLNMNRLNDESLEGKIKRKNEQTE